MKGGSRGTQRGNRGGGGGKAISYSEEDLLNHVVQVLRLREEKGCKTWGRTEKEVRQKKWPIKDPEAKKTVKKGAGRGKGDTVTRRIVGGQRGFTQPAKYATAKGQGKKEKDYLLRGGVASLGKKEPPHHQPNNIAKKKGYH